MKDRYLELQLYKFDWGWKPVNTLYLHNLGVEDAITRKNELIEQHNRLRDEKNERVRIIYRTEEEVTWGL